MTIISLRNNLKEALAVAERALGENAHLPVLKSFLLRAEKNNVSVSSTNLEIGIVTKFSAKIITEGSFVVPANIFSSLVANVPGERLDIKKTDTSSLEIKSDNYEAIVPLSAADDFPIIPEVENKKQYIEINAQIFIDALNQVIGSVQFSEIRPEISGVLFDFTLDQITLVGTDSFRLAEKKIPGSLFKNTYQEGFTCIIPLRTAEVCTKIFKKDEQLKLYLDKNQIGIQSEHTELVSRLIEGNFPDYKTIIPNGYETEIEMNRSDLVNALKFTGAAMQTTNEIKIRVKEDKKTFDIYSSERSISKLKTSLPAKIKGKECEVVFNWRYIFDGLKTIPDDSIRFVLHGNTRPALITSKDPTYLYVLMPIKQ